MEFLQFLDLFFYGKPVDRVHSPMDWIHGLSPPQLMAFIEYRPSAFGSTIEI
jgi:hypothetical protein